MRKHFFLSVGNRLDRLNKRMIIKKKKKKIFEFPGTYTIIEKVIECRVGWKQMIGCGAATPEGNSREEEMKKKREKGKDFQNNRPHYCKTATTQYSITTLMCLSGLVGVIPPITVQFPAPPLLRAQRQMNLSRQLLS